MDGLASLAREYYCALDEHDYAALADLLAPEFVHVRPDRRLEGREAFVRFMRDDRPNEDTDHRIDRIFSHEGNSGPAAIASVAAQGRLLDADGECFVEFVDIHVADEGRLTRIDTYARS